MSKERTNKRTETHACDLISRQKAIDANDAAFWETKNKKHYTKLKMLQSHAFLVETALKDLPPAQPDRSLWFRIGEICVDESKGFISAGRAVEKIRELLREAERRTDE